VVSCLSELPVSDLLNCYASTSEELDDGPRWNSRHSSWMPFPPFSAPSQCRFYVEAANQI
jgi:hypothetical protein